MSGRLMLRGAVVCLALLLCGKVGISETKVGIVSLQKAVLESAEVKKAGAALAAKYKPRQEEMEKLQKEIQAIQQLLQPNAKLTPTAQSELTAQGQRKQRELQRLNENVVADVNADQNEVLSKSGQKMQEVVRKLAEEKGLDLVVDTTNTVFFKPALDLTADAIAAYDKAYPAK